MEIFNAKKKKMPVYKLVIDESKDSQDGVYAIALVDEPAIMQGWQMFDKHKQRFQAQADRQIISGAAMIAGLPIYRNDHQGEYYVIFESSEIEKIAMKFMEKGLTKGVNMMHDNELIPEGVFIFESFIIDSKRGITTPKGFDELPDGSWFVSMKVNNKELWDKGIKSGVFTGFSIEGFFSQVELGEKNEKSLIEEIEEILSK